MGMCALKMMLMVVAAPQVPRIVVGDQQALPMMPARAEDIIIFLALCRPLVLAQTLPLAVLVLPDTPGHQRSRDDAIPRCFKEKAEVDVHQAIEAELFVDPADLRQQFAAERHQVSFNSINIRAGRLAELAQVIR